MIVIHALRGGGSEHVVARMASVWADRGRAVTVITLDAVENDAIPVSPAVRRIGLGLMSESSGLVSALRANWRRVKAIRRAILDVEPDHVIAFTEKSNILTLLACRGTRHRAVITERTDVQRHPISRLWRTLRRGTYPRARAVVVQTESAQQSVSRLSGNAPVFVIPNCVWPLESESLESAGQRLKLATDRNWIAGVGRLSFEKGFDRLIEAFAILAGSFPDWSLVLVGDGPERERLQLQIQSSGLADRVRLAGWIENPWCGLSPAALFVLPSRYEGFPNALLEAMASGLPVVAFDCPAGPRAIIRDGIDGLLVPDGDLEQLAAAMTSLMRDDWRRQQLAENARSISERFSVERYFDDWEAVLA